MEETKIGILGGGQLGRMLAEAVKKNPQLFPDGILINVLDPSPQGQSPAQPFIDGHIQAHLSDDKVGIRLARMSNYLTIEVEHIKPKVLKKAEEMGLQVTPTYSILSQIQNKATQIETFKRFGLPTPQTQLISNRSQLEDLLSKGDLMIKGTVGSYDGKGNLRLSQGTSGTSLDKALEKRFEYGDFLGQEIVDFEKEISVIVARDVKGKMFTYNVGENVHTEDFILDKTYVIPGRIERDLEFRAQQYAKTLIGGLGYVGIMGVEMFVKKDGEIVLNEVAPRVHNSGHWTQNGTDICQFTQHMLATIQKSIIKPSYQRPTIMVNILGREDYEEGKIPQFGLRETLPEGVSAQIHSYDKTNKARRKIGHINLTVKDGKSVPAMVEYADSLSNEGIIFN